MLLNPFKKSRVYPALPRARRGVTAAAAAAAACKHVYILGEGRRGGERKAFCGGDKQRFALWDLWFHGETRARGILFTEFLTLKY